MPAISGSSRSPEAVALAPRTDCRNRGTKNTPPKSEKPPRKVTAVETKKVRSRKSRRGTSGSGAERSTSRNARRSAAAPVPRATTVGEPQANLVPPQVVISTTHVASVATRTAPA